MECGETCCESEANNNMEVKRKEREDMKIGMASSEVSEEENIRRQIREDNLKNHRMVRTRGGLKYEVDVTKEDRKSMR